MHCECVLNQQTLHSTIVILLRFQGIITVIELLYCKTSKTVLFILFTQKNAEKASCGSVKLANALPNKSGNSKSFKSYCNISKALQLICTS